ncbi:hypothetical protein BC830DRAFT_1088398 [Chytriomyces sp. MP71]|nr:hypothetical protein BC830DRAFT_1088398 [Chytriomyces sp. MP71]
MTAEPLIDTPTFFASSLQTDAGYMAQMRVESKPHTQRFPFEAQGGGSLAVAHGDTGRELHTDKAFDSDGLRRESVHSESSLFHKRFGQGEQSSENQRGAQGAIMAKFQQFDSDGDDSIHDRTMINNPAERAREHSVQQTVLDTLSMLSRHSGNEANTMSLRGILQTNAAGPRSSSDGNLERSSFEVADSSSFADPKPLDAADVNNRNQRSLGTTHSFLTVESDGYRPAASRDVEEKNAALSAQERNAKTKNIEAETSSATFPRKRASRSFPILAVAGEELVTEGEQFPVEKVARRFGHRSSDLGCENICIGD